MKPHLAIVAAPFALLAACGVAWAQEAGASEPDLITAASIVGAALIGTLTLTWLVVQIVKSVLNPVRGHIEEHQNLRRIVLGPDGGGNGPGVIQRLGKLESVVIEGDTATAHELRKLRALLTSKPHDDEG